MPNVSVPLRFIIVLALTWILAPRPAPGQSITRWIDANGVVNFTTSSPPPGTEYEAIDMPVYRRAGVRETSPAEPKESDEKAAASPHAPAPAKTGGAPQLTVKDQATTSLGGASWVLSGKVTNEGGSAADGVGIHINVLEDGQGNPCLEDRASVSPSTLQPGEAGTFEVTYDSPCFYGRPQIDIVAEWK